MSGSLVFPIGSGSICYDWSTSSSTTNQLINNNLNYISNASTSFYQPVFFDYNSSNKVWETLSKEISNEIDKEILNELLDAAAISFCDKAVLEELTFYKEDHIKIRAKLKEILLSNSTNQIRVFKPIENIPIDLTIA